MKTAAASPTQRLPRRARHGHAQYLLSSSSRARPLPHSYVDPAARLSASLAESVLVRDTF